MFLFCAGVYGSVENTRRRVRNGAFAVAHLHSYFEVCQQLGSQSCPGRLDIYRDFSQLLFVPPLAEATSLYTLNAGNLRAVGTILFVFSMIDSEEERSRVYRHQTKQRPRLLSLDICGDVHDALGHVHQLFMHPDQNRRKSASCYL